jgi:hypothetical protein
MDYWSAVKGGVGVYIRALVLVAVFWVPYSFISGAGVFPLPYAWLLGGAGVLTGATVAVFLYAKRYRPGLLGAAESAQDQLDG